MDRSEFLTATPCAICNSRKTELVFPASFDVGDFNSYNFSARRFRQVLHYEMVKCSECGLVRAKEVVNEAFAANLYSESEFLYSDVSGFVSDSYFSLFRELNLKMGLSPEAQILEVGCGNGQFLEKIHGAGFKNIIGVDIAKNAVDRAPEVIRTKLINKPFGPGLFRKTRQKFDLICNFHILDHLYNPAQFVKDCFELLHDTGYVLTVCHDVNSWTAKLLGARSPIFDLQHVYMFDEDTVLKLFGGHGFAPVEVGQLINTYPLGYWIKLFPNSKFIADKLPKAVSGIKIKIKPGNLYALVRKG